MSDQPSTIPALDGLESQVAASNRDEHLVDLVLYATHEGPSTSLDEKVDGQERRSLVSVGESVIRDQRLSQSRRRLAPDAD
jgi:hypothetical protein